MIRPPPRSTLFPYTPLFRSVARGRPCEEHARILPPRSGSVRRLARTPRACVARACDRNRSRGVFRLALFAALLREEAWYPLEHPGEAALQPEALLPVPLARAAHRDRSHAQARPPEEAAAVSKDALGGRCRSAARAARPEHAARAPRPRNAGSALRERAARLGARSPEARRIELRHGRGARFRQGFEGTPRASRGGSARLARAVFEGGPPAALEEAGERLRVRHRARCPHDAAGVLASDQEARRGSASGQITFAPHAAPRLRHAFAQPWCRSARRADVAGPRRYLDHADLHLRCARAAEEAAQGPSPARVTWTTPAISVFLS